MKLAVTHTVLHIHTYLFRALLLFFFFKCEFSRQGWHMCVFFPFSVLAHWCTDRCTECFPQRYSPSSTSVRTPLFPAPLPLWLINPLSIIWSQSITPFYRLSGGITISLSGAPLRMADPYQTGAMPWTKEPLWSSLHSATNVSISTGCSCCMTVWTGLRFLSAVGRGRVWWMRMIQFRVEGVDDGAGGVQEYLDADPDWGEVETGCSFLKLALKIEHICSVFVLRWF